MKEGSKPICSPEIFLGAIKPYYQVNAIAELLVYHGFNVEAEEIRSWVVIRANIAGCGEFQR